MELQSKQTARVPMDDEKIVELYIYSGEYNEYGKDFVRVCY